MQWKLFFTISCCLLGHKIYAQVPLEGQSQIMTERKVSVAAMGVLAKKYAPTSQNNVQKQQEIGHEKNVIADVDVNIPINNYSNPHAYALIFGNEDYSSYQQGLNSEVDVAYAVNDANIFKRYCTSVLGISDDNIFFQKNATSGQMGHLIKVLNTIIQKENGEADVFVYYAGHGLPDEKTHEPYLIPVDVSGADLNGAIKLHDLYAKLAQFPSKRVTVFLDACFSGGGRNVGLIAARGVKVKPKEDVLNGNIVVFTSSSGEQSSLPYKEKKHGMFTYYLLKKMQETKGDVKYSELFDYLKREVDLNCVKINSKEQTPFVMTSLSIGNQWEKWNLK